MSASSIMHKCQNCKKEFYVFDGQWGYTLTSRRDCKRIYFCSYSCMRKYEIPRLDHVNKKIRLMAGVRA